MVHLTQNRRNVFTCSKRLQYYFTTYVVISVIGLGVFLFFSNSVPGLGNELLILRAAEKNESAPLFRSTSQTVKHDNDSDSCCNSEPLSLPVKTDFVRALRSMLGRRVGMMV